jgi:carbonic anhydrase
MRDASKIKAASRIAPEMMIRKLFDFHSNSQPYVAGAVVVSCFDARIRLARDEFLRRYGVAHPDLVIIAGGSLALSSPRTNLDRAFVLDQVQLAIRLHRASRVILMSHSDCATYGGLAAFNGDRQRERAHHAGELCRASTVIRGEFHGLQIERVFLTFDSVLSVGDEECAED